MVILCVEMVPDRRHQLNLGEDLWYINENLKKPKKWQNSAYFTIFEKSWGNRMPQTSINRVFQKPRVEMVFAR